MGTPSLIRLCAGFLLVAVTALGEDPWAVSVVGYASGEGFYPGYTLPESALGRPTVDTYVDMEEEEPSVAVVPVFPPWDWSELVSLGEGGELVLELGVSVVSDPANPYGVDLLVFGNSMITGTGLYDQVANTPEGYTLADTDKIGVVTKVGVVSVSDDLTTWYAFDAPEVGNLLPTLGRIWDEEAGGWGAPTDPRVPPDPSVEVKELAEMPLVDLLRLYRGGAGGTGFSLAALNLPEGAPDSFRYVRIHVPPKPEEWPDHRAYRTEIDAVTVVRPATRRRRWEIAHFSWLEDPSLERRYPWVEVGGEEAVRVHLPDSAEAESWGLEGVDDLEAGVWEDVEAVFEDSAGEEGFLIRVFEGPDVGAFRFYRVRLEDTGP